MKNIIKATLLLSLCLPAFANDDIQVVRNFQEGQQSIEHSTCKVFNEGDFFDRRARRTLSRKGYIFLDEKPEAELSLNTDFEASSYMIPKQYLIGLRSSSQSINGRSRNSVEQDVLYGFDEVAGGIFNVTVTIGGQQGPDMTILGVRLMGAHKKQNKLDRNMRRKAAELMPACQITADEE